MIKKIKSLFKYLYDEVDITIAPPVQYKMKSFTLRRITAFIILLCLLTSILSLSYLYKTYERKYQQTAKELKTIRNNELQDMKRVKTENKLLKNQIYSLSDDVIKLDNTIQELHNDSQQLKKALAQEVDVDFEEIDTVEQKNFSLQILNYTKEDLFESESRLGGDLRLHSGNPEKVVSELNKNVENLQEDAAINRDNNQELKSSFGEYEDRKEATPAIWPLDDEGDSYISSSFGWRTSPNTGENEFHEGLDIGVWTGTPVMVTADGEVSYTGWKSGYGYTIEVQHKFGFVTRYAHLDKIKVRNEQQVTRGEVIGLSGNSGNSTGPHLHYEVLKDGVPQDPEKYIEK
ncbi:MAG: M23 family metallopeptidase [Bacillota bacterium]